jgi:soluble lytic murein transglycosylase-like protein
MTTTNTVRSWRMTTLACLVATGGFAQAAMAEDSAQGFFMQEKVRLAASKPEDAARKPLAEKKPVKAERKSSPVRTTRASSNAQPMAAAPEGLKDIVRREAEANGVPVTLASAVVSIESRWNPKVTGSAGEVGLMQIKYPTARMIGYKGTRKALYDPATNIRWGMKYLAGAHKLAGGDLCHTVSKYQGGHAVKGVTRMGAVYCGKARTIIASMTPAKPRLALNDRAEPRG